jgi:flagellar M-ring protein FliF
MWRDPVYLALAKEIGKFLITALILLYLYLKIVRPMMRPVLRKIDEVTGVPPSPERLAEENAKQEAEEKLPEIVLPTPEEEANRIYQENLELARNVAKADPRVVANVIKSWIGPQ